jgi:hypothetical protein
VPDRCPRVLHRRIFEVVIRLRLSIVIWAKSVQAFLSDCLLPRCVLAAFLLGLPAGAALAQQSPTSFDALAASAAAARDNHDVTRAIQLYTEAEQLKPEWPGGWWSLGLLQYSTQDWSAARNAFTH